MQINDFIYHEKYGIGKITSLDGRFITVDFSGTPKQFLKSDGSKFLKPAIQNQFVVVSGEQIYPCQCMSMLALMCFGKLACIVTD